MRRKRLRAFRASAARRTRGGTGHRLRGRKHSYRSAGSARSGRRARNMRSARSAPPAFGASWQAGYRDGRKAGYNPGYDKGFEEGVASGLALAAVPFEGTSIIIPTFNQKDLLLQCLTSIFRYTPEPFELIVVDNGSTDGTEEELRKLAGRVRMRRNAENAGFACAVNQGLMMARGTTLLVLNNDTVVSHRWLSNLLACVHSDPAIGLVGPVSNSISGEQLIPTSYGTLEEMHRFADGYNRSDPAKWRATERLTGFCLLMRRDTFARLGFFDEGFRIGNCEDDDYGHRARLLGYRMVIAGDTMVHHVGSASMKQLGDQFDEVYGRNLDFFAAKWRDPGGWLRRPGFTGAEAVASGLAPWNGMEFAPQHVVVRGAGPELYWLENGVRRPLAGPPEGLPPENTVRISQVEVRSLPRGDAMTMGEAFARLAARQAAALSQASLPQEGSLVTAPDGQLYQLERGRLRPFLNERAREAWKLDGCPAVPISAEQSANFSYGPPIIAPCAITVSGI